MGLKLLKAHRKLSSFLIRTLCWFSSRKETFTRNSTGFRAL